LIKEARAGAEYNIVTKFNGSDRIDATKFIEWKYN
jgi:hypothetical protein